MAEQTPVCNFGWKAPDFALPGVDGKTYSLDDIKGENGTLVMFICNHCPYVKAVIDRAVRDAKELEAYGINTVAICSNDAEHYPEDSFANMKRFAAEHGFTFPYLHDESQEVARCLRRHVHPRLLRLQRQARAAISRPARREPQRSGAGRCPP